MIYKPDFIFRTNISSDFYLTKADAKACLSRAGAKAVGKEKMAFTEHKVTPAQFLGYATSGYTFCNLFAFDPNLKYPIESYDRNIYYSFPTYRRGPNKGCMKLSFKSDLFFLGSQTVFVDVDFTRYPTIPEYLGTLTYQPTLTYMSFSDKLEKSGRISRRFRLVYVFDEVLMPDEFKRISTYISNMVVACTGEPMDDDCGTRMAQYMNGTNNSQEIYCSNLIYSKDDFPMEETPECVEQEETENALSTVTFDKFLVYYMEKLTYEDFMHSYSMIYKYIYRTETPEWVDGRFQATQDGYLQLFYYPEKVQDGNHRRSKLFKNACLRRLIKPDIDADTLLFNLYIDREKFFDNEDGVIDIDTMKRKVKNAFSMSREELENYCRYEIEYWSLHRPKHIFKSGTARSQINSDLKDIKYAGIAEKYDCSMSVKENIEAGIDIPQSTLYRFCKDMGINTQPGKITTREERREIQRKEKIERVKFFMELYESGLSQKTIWKKMNNRGISISLGSVNSWCKKYGSGDSVILEPDWLSPALQVMTWNIPEAS